MYNINTHKGWKWKNGKLYLYSGKYKFKKAETDTPISKKNKLQEMSTTRDLNRDIT